ncbi:hypothetical protein DFR76_104140 [Nocardia pseudobrasiliensis]|uniref:Uncharacterized protein n=1 Tax=Nocardia pseudobrasiliensis TaxID=45979 RepID=A0A370IAF2_9NOCA|nr:hypothetical protein [Nocardia pseudobrasiliensis]RDI66394.1 hypothetical protein DFR76_104140 [Nocardia pseudobrasiliensis]
MSDESNQLSVAELLARNGQGVPSSSGGRRRRGGRGIAVTDLTGDLPAVPEGSSAHAAPEPDESPAIPPFPLSTPVEPSHSPVSGPISYYDPLSHNGASATPSYDPPSYEPPSYDPPSYEPRSYSAPAVPDSRDSAELGWPPSPAAQAPSSGGRRARRERMEALEAQEAAQAAANSHAPAPGLDAPASGRRRRRESDEETTEVRPYRGPLPQNDTVGPPTQAWAPTRAPEPNPRAPLPDSPPASVRRDRSAERGFGGFDLGPERGLDRGPERAPDRPDRGGPDRGGLLRGGRRNGVDGPPQPGPPQPGLPAWSARRPTPPEPDRPARNGRPAPEDQPPTAAWQAANRDQQLLAGPTVAGDLMRDAAERGDRRGMGGPGERGPRRGGADVLEDVEHRTELLRPLDSERDDVEDDEPDAEPTRRRTTRTRTPVSRRSRVARKATEDENRKQWMILGGQAVGAAVAGMLLFKGFEKMWDLLPFVALLLAMVVILGLVALVRVLRRTDDIFSTVIAVVVGIFVTLGPLAFLLSTN